MAHMRDPDPIPEEGPAGRNRCCFCFPGFSRRSSGAGLSFWERVGSSRGHTDSGSSSSSSQLHQQQNRWWSRGIEAFKRIREWSEIVAGPKWKTFIRRFNRGGGRGSGRHGKFQYDPLSYALNFDEGQNGYPDEEEGDYGGFRDFSSRYASVSVSGRPLAMDAAAASSAVRSGITSNDVAVIG
ncbi:hypothetical protein Tsubulata_044774 [Turnera subulata]|uniref:Uncharacterized protein n=1 Tax=Turnera subulata TaxID=218843 RepID=A0A9Q0GFA8_9ROSI|nr:hypothetical protein Tsubulata_044774 [Turnera subulata]